jgi:hypothetical protein
MVWAGVLFAVAGIRAGDGSRSAAASVVLSPASSFVTLYPAFEAEEIDAYSLSTGDERGTVVHLPLLRSIGRNPSVSTPHLLAGGDYLLTLGRGARCRRSGRRCRPVPDSCASDVITLDPASGRATLVLAITGAWRVLDAVPSPDGQRLAIVEYPCGRGSTARLVVSDLAGHDPAVVTNAMSPCGLESDVSWNAASTAVAFAYGAHPDRDNPPVGCGLVTVPAAAPSAPSD